MSPELTKLRLLREVARRAHERAAEAELKARRDWDAASVAYFQAGRAEGICVVCEKPLADCKCVFMAAPAVGEE